MSYRCIKVLCYPYKASWPPPKPGAHQLHAGVFQAECIILYYLLCSVSSRFHLTGIAFQYLLKLVSAHLPDSKRCVSSLYMLKKWCLKMFPGYKCTPVYYCVRCTAPASEKNHCKSCGGKNIGRFVMADIASQLKTKFEDEFKPAT